MKSFRYFLSNFIFSLLFGINTIFLASEIIGSAIDIMPVAENVIVATLASVVIRFLAISIGVFVACVIFAYLCRKYRYYWHIVLGLLVTYLSMGIAVFVDNNFSLSFSGPIDRAWSSITGLLSINESFLAIPGSSFMLDISPAVAYVSLSIIQLIIILFCAGWGKNTGLAIELADQDKGDKGTILGVDKKKWVLLLIPLNIYIISAYITFGLSAVSAWFLLGNTSFHPVILSLFPVAGLILAWLLIYVFWSSAVDLGKKKDHHRVIKSIISFVIFPIVLLGLVIAELSL